MSPVQSKKILSLTLKALVSAFFVIWLIFKVHWIEVWEIVRHISMFSIGLYILLLLSGIGISALKWKTIARTKGFEHSWSEYFWTYLSGTFINNFLPGFVGGDAYRSYWLGKEEKRYTAAASTVVLDRLTGLVAAMILALVCSLLRWDVMVSSPLWLFLEIVMVGVLSTLLVWHFVGRWRMVQTIASMLPQKIVSFLGELTSKKEGRFISRMLLLSLAFNGVGVGLANLTLFLGLDPLFDWKSYFSVIFLMSIIASIPVSINNIGIKEWAYVTFFGLFGMRPELAVTVALLGRAIQMLVSFLALPVYLKQRN